MTNDEDVPRGFEAFRGRRRSNRPLPTPTVSIWSGAGESFVLNRAAYDALGRPLAVLLLWDAADRCVGFRSASADDPRAYRVRPTPSGAFRVAGRAFRRRYGLDALPTARYAATMADGDLVVRLGTDAVWRGYEIDAINAIIDERKSAEARAREPKLIAEHGAIGRGRDRDSDATSINDDRGADYLTARIARDRPDILERMRTSWKSFHEVRCLFRRDPSWWRCPACSVVWGVGMPDVPAETVTIAEAAALLGVHRNTVRNRIKAGRYKAHKVVTPQGDTYAIDRESLGVAPANEPHNPSHTQVRHNGANGPQLGHVVAEAQEASQLAVVQRLLAPFVEELSRTNAELGRAQERLAATERERDELRGRVADLEAERLDASVSRQDVPGAAEASKPIDEPRSGLRAWWRRLWGGV